MKPSRPLPFLLSCLAAAASILIPIHRAAADDSYRVETHGPRIGSPLLFFIKDLAYGQNPNDRYRSLPANQSRMGPQQNTYSGQSGGGFNLDQPPPVNSIPSEGLGVARSPRPARDV